jgi:Tol biopolymer transport system component
MTVNDELEHQLRDWLGEVATPRDVDISAVFARTGSMDQRPAWTRPSMWFARPTRWSQTFGTLPVLLVTVGLIVAFVIAALLIGSRPKLPAPVGPARSGLVTFDSDGDIFAVQPDGSGRTRLVGGAGVQFGPAWSPDGTRLAYWSAPDRREPASLWALMLDGSPAVKLSGDRTFYTDRAPIWAPDNKRIAFATGTGELRVMNADGSNLRRIGDPAITYLLPTWSPDGSWIAVRATSIDDERFLGYVIRPDGTGATQITTATFMEEAHGGLVWSPDSRSVAYHTGVPTDFDIAISRLDASGLWREEVLIDGTNYDVVPAWSNDGTRIAFIRTDGLGTARQISHLMVANAGGGDARMIGDRAVDRYSPCWSPDDRFIRVMSYSTVDLGPVVDLIAVDGSAVVEFPIPGWSSSDCAWQRLAP